MLWVTSLASLSFGFIQTLCHGVYFSHRFSNCDVSQLLFQRFILCDGWERHALRAPDSALNKRMETILALAKGSLAASFSVAEFRVRADQANSADNED
jgi:hypothetical protein